MYYRQFQFLHQMVQYNVALRHRDAMVFLSRVIWTLIGFTQTMYYYVPYFHHRSSKAHTFVSNNNEATYHCDGSTFPFIHSPSFIFGSSLCR